jgi:hypothetical protein
VTTAAVVPFAALALLGLAAADDRAPRVYAVVKPLATASLFLVLAPDLAEGLRLGVGVGLALSTCGDAALVRKADRRFFYAGMALFALAHAAYALTLLLTVPGRTTRETLAALATAAIVTAVQESFLVPRVTPTLRFPVAAYGAILGGTAAGGIAWLASDAPHRVAIFLGALLLHAGDAFYAFNLFVRRLRFGQSAGLVLYWGGQLALVLGVRLSSS